MSATAMFCRSCGKALTEEEKAVPESVYCSACKPAEATAPPRAPAGGTVKTAAAATSATSGVSPALAFILGFIPGVGAIYNTQYAKGLIHALIFGLLVSIADSPSSRGTGPVIGLLITAWVLYMPFEAYHTAKRRLSGEQVDEFSSLVSFEDKGGFPAAPVALIAIGVLFLLNNLGILTIGLLLPYWPVLLIALGIYMLWVRLKGPPAPSPAKQEAGNEQ